MNSRRVAVVVPVPQPYVRGGAENLYDGLSSAIASMDNTSCDVVAVPSPEGTFWDLLRSYREFLMLDLSSYDCVVSTKYPSWMLQHHNHVCYMLHKLRGLYDTYGLFGLPLDVDYGTLPECARFVETEIAREASSSEQVVGFIDRLLQLEQEFATHPAFQLPSPFTRAVVHWLDDFGLRPSVVKGYFAISKNVIGREGYFPPGVAAEAVYPDTSLKTLLPGKFDYFFTASRLDCPKRIHLIIEAFKHVVGEVRLLIAGTGPDLERLRGLAEGDERIEFLGHVRDEVLAEYYANARCVVFVPYDEDLGYITIEALRSGKPVITTIDSGGPTEFVAHGVNGLVVPPDRHALAGAMQVLIDDPGKAIAMGSHGPGAVEQVRWGRAVRRLLPVRDAASDSLASGKTSRPKVVLVSTYPVYPPRGGGQARIFHVWRHVAAVADVVLVCSVPSGETPSDTLIAPGFREVRVPRSRELEVFEVELSRSVDWVPVTDIAHAAAPHLATALRLACAEETTDADLLVLEHPYLSPMLRGLDLPEVWYGSHNHETTMKARMLPDSEAGRSTLEIVRQCEVLALELASTVIGVSDADLEGFRGEGWPIGRESYLVPNGFDLDSVRFHSHSERRALRGRLGFEDAELVLILASWHGPNLEAVEAVITVAPRFADVVFLVVGSVGEAFKTRDVPCNVLFLGAVTDEEKDVLLGSASVAINPMKSGGGSNLKLFDYLASGAPTVTSEFGARGSGIDASHAWIFGGEAFDEALYAALREALDAGIGTTVPKCEAARAHVERKFEWRVLARPILEVVDRMAAVPRRLRQKTTLYPSLLRNQPEEAG